MIDYDALLSRASRNIFEEAVLTILENPKEIERALVYFEMGKTTDRNRVAWLMQHVSDEAPEVLKPYHRYFITHATKAKTDAEKRFISRLFANHGLPEEDDLQDELLNIAFDWAVSLAETVAVKVNSLSILLHFCAKHPDIKPELRAIIESQWDTSTAAFRSRGRKILKAL